MKVYNDCFEVNSKFESSSKSKNNRIQRYKDPRGFPLVLPPGEKALYSMDHDITLHLLDKFKAEKENELRQLEKEKKKSALEELNNSFDPDSCDDEMPFDFETSRARYSNTEKRTSKFDPLSTRSMVKGDQAVDIDMEMEEAKSETEKVHEENKNNFGSISVLFKSNAEEKPKETLSPFDGNESEGLRLQRSSNISCKATLPANQMLRFSDLENMDDEYEDFDMNDVPQTLSFKR